MPRNTLLLVLLLLLSACQGNKSSLGLAERFVVIDRLPSQQIRAFAEDSRGYVWIGTYGALCRYNGQTYNQYFMDDDSSANRNYSVNCLMADESENLWIGTVNGLYCFRYGSGFMKVSSEYVNMICDSPTGYIFFDNMSSVWRVDKKTMEVTEFHNYGSGNQVYGPIVTDKFGKGWICDGEELTCKDIVSGSVEARVGIRGIVRSALSVGNNIFLSTDKDFFCLDPYSKRLEETTEFHRVYEELKDEEIGDMFPLNENTFFIYTKAPRLYVYSSKGIRIWSSDKLTFMLAGINHGYDLSALFIDSKKNFWIGTDYDGFQMFSSRQTMFVDDEVLKTAFNNKCVTSLQSDRNGDILIVAEGKNLFRYDNSGRITQIKRKSNEEIVGTLPSKDGRTYLACSRRLYAGQLRGDEFDVTEEWEIQAKAIAEDMDGDIYVRALNGPLLMKPAGSGEFKELNIGEGEMKIVKLQCLHDGRMAMLDANEGVFVSEKLKVKSEKLEDESEELVCLGSGEDVIYTDFCEDEKGNLWLSTYGRGIVCVDPVTSQSNHYLSDEYCHEVVSMVRDNWGNIWMGTNNGLTRYQPSTGKFITFYENVGIAGNEFSPRSALLTSDNRLMFGSINGITYFSPEQISSVRQERIMMEYLTVNGEHIQDLAADNEVHLPYDNAAVDISFTTLQYGESASSYEYQMEGFDPTVTSIRGTEHAYYTHLPQGKYTFRVKVLGTTDRLSEQTVRVIVHPDFWGLPIMKWFVYPLLGILVFLFALWVTYKRYLLRQRLLSAEYDSEQERKLNEFNMRFFSNISHEFRTPLTLINGALSMIKTGGDDRLHEIMRQNTGRMLRLVNQLMDFNKLEGGMLRLSVSKTDVSQLLRDIMSMFEASLKRLNIEFSLLLPDEPVVTLIDTDKFEKIMVNLVSNAVKYSGEGSKLTVRLSVSEDKQLRVEVADTGIGVPEDKREAIFGRFYQLKQAGQLPAIGTGVGLYYTRSLVELHHGRISCSANEPKGSVFSFTLPMNEDAYSSDERQASVKFVSDEPSRFGSEESRVKSEECSDGQEVHTYRLMVVDDDHDVLSFLQLLLSPHYEVIMFTDAAKAYQEIEATEPDLILSDVMMYQIDGYKFCHMIKDNSSICHIPVVLLTAKSAMSEQIHGLACGASAYVTKPFSPDYLLAMLKSQLENVRYIQQALRGTTKVEEREEKLLEEADRKLMQSFYDFFEEHLADPVLQVDELTKYLGMSRTKVFYKLKGLTGDTPSAFFKTYKLNRAAEMILQGNEKIAYIADITGFSSTSHFSTSFKKQFNCSPSEYKGTKN